MVQKLRNFNRKTLQDKDEREMNGKENQKDVRERKGKRGKVDDDGKDIIKTGNVQNIHRRQKRYER